jgi:hypothetical protein
VKKVETFCYGTEIVDWPLLKPFQVYWYRVEVWNGSGALSLSLSLYLSIYLYLSLMASAMCERGGGREAGVVGVKWRQSVERGEEERRRGGEKVDVVVG